MSYQNHHSHIDFYNERSNDLVRFLHDHWIIITQDKSYLFSCTDGGFHLSVVLVMDLNEIKCK